VESDPAAKSPVKMSMWVVYAQPRDYPMQYVLRLWELRDEKMIATNQMGLADSLEEVREMLPPGLFRLSRFDNDDPCIVEVWL
jgi:hypothetical protein